LLRSKAFIPLYQSPLRPARRAFLSIVTDFCF
jgi:hypothetical protein